MLRRRWLIIALILLACLAAGAGWAALADPSYRATAVLDDPNILITNAVFDTDSFRAAADPLGRSELATSVELVRSGNRVDVVVDAASNVAATEIAELYSSTALAESSTVRLLDAAAFPLRPRTPNLTRIALISAAVGLVLGIGQAVLVDRLLRPGKGSKANTSADAGASDRELTPTLAEVDLQRPDESAPPLDGLLPSFLDSTKPAETQVVETQVVDARTVPALAPRLADTSPGWLSEPQPERVVAAGSSFSDLAAGESAPPQELRTDSDTAGSAPISVAADRDDPTRASDEERRPTRAAPDLAGDSIGRIARRSDVTPRVVDLPQADRLEDL